MQTNEKEKEILAMYSNHKEEILHCPSEQCSWHGEFDHVVVSPTDVDDHESKSCPACGRTFYISS